MSRDMAIAKFLLALGTAAALVVELKVGAETEREGRTVPLKEFGC